MKKKVIAWNEDGWTTIQDADAEKHILEISCFAEGGKVTQIRKRHNDGEEEKITKAVGNVSLPVAFDEFKTLVEGGKISW